jgi:hypothetical protein
LNRALTWALLALAVVVVLHETRRAASASN